MAVLLTRQERNVLELCAQGKSQAEVAVGLGLALDTVSWHLGKIRRKFGASSTMAAVDEAISQGVLRGSVGTARERLLETALVQARACMSRCPSDPQLIIVNRCVLHVGDVPELASLVVG